MRQQPRQPDRGPESRIKGLLSRNIYSKRESWTTALSLTEQGQKAACQRKIPLIRKSYSLWLRVIVTNGRSWSKWRWWWVRTSWANHKSMWQRFGVLRAKRQNASLKGTPVPIPVGGGGLVLTQHQSKVTEADGQCNTCNGSSGRPGTVLETLHFTGELQYVIFYNIILGLGKMKPESIPGNTVNKVQSAECKIPSVCQKYAVHISLLIQGSQSRTQSTFVNVHSPRNNFCGIRIAVQDTTFFLVQGTQSKTQPTWYKVQVKDTTYMVLDFSVQDLRHNLYGTRLFEEHYNMYPCSRNMLQVHIMFCPWLQVGPR